MFKYFREEMSSTATKVVLSLLILSFLILGFHGFNTKDESSVYSKNGIEVTKKELSRAYSTALSNMDEAQKNNINNSEEGKKYLINLIIENIVNEKNMLNKLSAMGFSFSVNEFNNIRGEIEKNFNSIEIFMNKFGYTQSELVADLKKRATLNQINSAINLTKPEWPTTTRLIDDSYKTLKTMSVLDVAKPSVNVKDEDVEKYFNENRTFFMNKPYVLLQEKFLDINKITDVKPSDDTMKKFFKKNLEWYSKPEYVKAKLYNIISGKNPKKFEFLSKEQIAELKSSNQTLRLLGNRVFVKNTTEPAMYQLLSDLKKGDTEFISIDGRELICLIVEKHSEYVPKFTDVKNAVLKDYKQYLVRKNTEKFKKYLLSKSNQSAPKNVIVQNTKYFRGDNITGIDHSWISNTSNLGKSKIVQDKNGFIKNITIKKYVQASYQDFKNVKNHVKSEYINTLVQKLWQENAKKMLASKKVKGKPLKVNFSKQKFHNVPTDKLMALQFKGDDYKAIYDTKNGPVVVHLLAVKKGGANINVDPSLLTSYKNDYARLFANYLLSN